MIRQKKFPFQGYGWDGKIAMNFHSVIKCVGVMFNTHYTSIIITLCSYHSITATMVINKLSFSLFS